MIPARRLALRPSYLRVPRAAALALVASFAAVASAGCALTSKGEALDVRYFTPEHARPRLTSGAVAKPTMTTGVATPIELRLGRVTSGPHLRERIAYRDGGFEIGYYDDRQWTERPEEYVRRSLARTLFEERGFARVLGGTAPNLEVEVVSFDEVRAPGAGRLARVQLRMIVSDGRNVVLEDTITVERPVAPPASGGKTEDRRIEAFVAAMAEALDAAADEVATRLTTSLRERAAAPKAP